jgi:GNAT superfamily N-acetyltransferase
MDDTTLYARMHANLRAFCRYMGGASPGARAIEIPGVVGGLVPATPHRSLFNSVAYDSPPELEAALPELAAAYAGADIRAWSVWVPEADTRTSALLAERGHVLDAAPAVMCMELSDLAESRPADLDLDPEPRVETLAQLNDIAYGTTPDVERAVQSLPGVPLYVARVEERPVSCLGMHDLDGDTCVLYVATVPEARGRGLARKLLAYALHDARERGVTTSSLQATKMGYPVYARLGYRDLGGLQMWELREP